MIPTLIFFGLVFGRWWKSALVGAAIGWPLLLLVSGTLQSAPKPLVGVLAQAVGLAVVNAGVGVAIHQAVLRMIRGMRSRGEE